MTTNDDLKSTYNRIAQPWHDGHKTDDWWKDGTDYFCSKLQKGSRVLDVGCGAGIKSKYLTDKGFKVTGIDFAEKLIDIAWREVPGVDFRVLDMRNVAALNEKFDGIFAQASLLHISHKEIEEVLERLCFVLKNGGLFYIAVKGKRAGGVDEHVLTEDDVGFEYQRFFAYYTAKELTEPLKRFGVEEVYHVVNRVDKTDWIQLIGRKQ